MCKDGSIEDKVTGECLKDSRSIGDESNNISGKIMRIWYVKIHCSLTKDAIYFLRYHNCLHYWRNNIGDSDYYYHH